MLDKILCFLGFHKFVYGHRNYFPQEPDGSDAHWVECVRCNKLWAVSKHWLKANKIKF